MGVYITEVVKNVLQYKQSVTNGKGHFAKVCRNKRSIEGNSDFQRNNKYQQYNRQNVVQDKSDDESSQQSIGSYAHKQQHVTVDIPGNFSSDVLSLQAEPHLDIPPPIWINASVNGYTVKFHHDSGAATTVVSEEVWKKLGCPKLNDTVIQLRSYNQKIEVVGASEVTVEIQVEARKLWLVIVKTGESLLGPE